jgi:hypothetical protein
MNDLSRSAETYRSVYDRLFPAGAASPLELPDGEGKSYALTRANFDAHREKLVKTIATIANRTRDVGYIVCRGSTTEGPLVDGAIVDDAVRADVYPHVPLQVHRSEFDGHVVDIITVSPANRPHLMRNSSGEMIIPFRGAANNITAGRHELDRMYEERQVAALRRLLAKAGAPEDNPVDMFLNENDWGGLSETQDQEFVYAVVPRQPDQTPLDSFITANDAHAYAYNAFNATIDALGTHDWFAPLAGLVSHQGDGYLELYQPSRFKEHRMGTIRIYDIGAVVARIWILEPLIDGQRMFSFNHFKMALQGTLDFAWRIYGHAAYPQGDVEVRALVANAEDLDLWITPSNPRHVLPNRDVGPRLYIPKRPVVIAPHVLQDQAKDVAERVGRALKGGTAARRASFQSPCGLARPSTTGERFFGSVLSSSASWLSIEVPPS